MKRLTPQEKKALSYERDRRNTYGEAPHAARKGIPLSRAKRSRNIRRSQNQTLHDAPLLTNRDDLELMESQLHHRPLNNWKKNPDRPLGEVLAKKMRDREIMQNEGGRSAIVYSVPVEPKESES